MSCKVAIVVLHYESTKDTIECLDSLIQYIDEDKVRIIVVDNGSKIRIIEQIADKYSDIDQIEIMRSDENLGFSKGNNLGFLYAKRKYSPEIIVLSNNDIVYDQKEFIDKLLYEYKRTQFDLAGPQIMSLIDGKNQNPVGLVYHSAREVKKRIRKFRILGFLSKWDLDSKIKSFAANEIPEYEATGDYQLHGACMFFANRYVQEHDGLYDGTFMYGEEFILKYIVTKEKMKMIYLPDLAVKHKEGASTKAFWGKGKKQRQFFYKWSVDSLTQLWKMMKGNK